MAGMSFRLAFILRSIELPFFLVLLSIKDVHGLICVNLMSFFLLLRYLACGCADLENFPILIFEVRLGLM